LPLGFLMVGIPCAAMAMIAAEGVGPVAAL